MRPGGELSGCFLFMVLILSESNDTTTSQVMEWLIAMGKTVLRLNECDKMTAFSIINGNAQLQFFQMSTQQQVAFDLNAVDMFWFRKRTFNLKEWVGQQFGNACIEKYIDRELGVTAAYLHYLLSQKPNLAVLFTASMNKLVVNQMAVAVGLQIPAYIISTQKAELYNFLANHNDACITKAISETFFIQVEGGFLVSYTEPANRQDLVDYGDNMMPVLLQNKVDKKYELRIFYLNGTCYSSAIFSQNDKQTQVDFRKYNYAKPNRTVPFSLPAAVAEKIHLLMQQLNLKTGSIDMLVDQNGGYIFLEVNPVGQFGMVSEPCNYFLEQKVAQFLAAAS
jgi:ATP-GRASP peptide maturase of grasp-with-spasm system